MTSVIDLNTEYIDICVIIPPTPQPKYYSTF